MVKVIFKGASFSFERMVTPDQVKTTINALKSLGIDGSFQIEKI